jgi:hypothetical protein
LKPVKPTHPHSAFGLLHCEGEGIKRGALGQAQDGKKGISNLAQEISNGYKFHGFLGINESA